MRWLVGLLALLFAQSAAADPGDCNAPGYTSEFSFTGLEGTTCDEAFRFTFDTPEGPRIARGVALDGSGPALAPGAKEMVEAALKRAVEALHQTGAAWDVHDITVLMLNESLIVETEADGSQGLAAMTDDTFADDGRKECRIGLLLAGVADVDATATIAHEVFHCLQLATLSPAQMDTHGKGGTWWIEGTAELFSAVAVPESTLTTQNAELFNASVQSGTALNDMGYGAAVFFFWWHQEKGIGTIVDLMHTMPSVSGAEPQHDAMRRILGPQEWLRFAQAYVDQTILHPGGHDMFLDGTWDREWIEVSETGSQGLDLEPFVLFPGSARYVCAKWSNRLTPDDANIAIRTALGNDWLPWAGETDAREPDQRLYRFVAMETREGTLRLKLRFTRLEQCEPCQGFSQVDMCVVGSWEMDPRVILDKLAARGAPITRNALGPVYIVISEDGTYRTTTSEIDFQTFTQSTPKDWTQVDVAGVAGASLGRWAIAGPGQLAGCADLNSSGAVTLHATGPNFDKTYPRFLPGSGGEEGIVDYTCSDATMSTSMRMGALGIVEFPFTRLSPRISEDD